MKQASRAFFIPSLSVALALSFAFAEISRAQTEQPTDTVEPTVAAPVADSADTAEAGGENTDIAPTADAPEVVAPEEISAVNDETITIADADETAGENDALADEAVTEEDLGVNQARILPDSPLYALKRIGRNLRRAFIFDDAKKVEFDIRDANQELADLKRLIDEKGEAVSDVVLKGFDRMEERFERIAERAPDLAKRDEITKNDVVEHLLDSEIKRQKLFEHIQERANDERVLERVMNMRDRMAERVGDVVEGVGSDAEMFDRVLQNQAGSEFKDLRNLEVLRRIAERIPEQAREGIARAEENAFKRLREHVSQFENDGQWGRLDAYMRNFGGDQVVRFELLDKLEQNFDGNEIPDRARAKIKDARDFSARSFQDEFERIEGTVKDETRLARMREHMMERFQVEQDEEQPEFEAGFADDMSERFDLMAKFRANIDSEKLGKEMEAVEEKQIDSFVAAFPDARQDAEKAKQAMAELRTAAANGDFKKVKLLGKVVEEMKNKQMNDPTKRAFIEQMEQTERMAEQGFVEHLRKSGADSRLDAMVSDDPSHIQFLQKLKADFIANPQDFGGQVGEGNQFFDRAIDQQYKHFVQEDDRQTDAVIRGFETQCKGDVRCFMESKIEYEKQRTTAESLRRPPNGFVDEFGQPGIDPGSNGGFRTGPGSDLERRGLIPVPEGVERGSNFGNRPGASDLERTGLIPVPEGFDPGPVGRTGPGSDLERTGLIPVPEGVDRSPNSGSRPGASDLERTGLIPVPEGFDPGPVGIDGRSIKDTAPGGNPLPSPSPAPRSGGSDLERTGLIPVPIGDTQPGGNTGPTPAPVSFPIHSGTNNITAPEGSGSRGFDPGPVGRGLPPATLSR